MNNRKNKELKAQVQKARQERKRQEKKLMDEAQTRIDAYRASNNLPPVDWSKYDSTR